MSFTFKACHAKLDTSMFKGLAVRTSRQVVVFAATKGTRQMAASSHLLEELYLVDVRLLRFRHGNSPHQ